MSNAQKVMAQLATIPTLVTPAKAAGLPGDFSHDPGATSAASPGRSRRHHVRVMSGHAEGRSGPSITRMAFAAQVCVDYVADKKAHNLHAAILADAVDLIRAYADQRNWIPEIHAISIDGADVGPFEVVEEEGLARLKFTLQVRFTP